MEGYQITYEEAGDGFLTSVYFPTKTRIKTEKEAWKLCRVMASVTKGNCVNFYVVDKNGPTKNYKQKKIINR